jgi:DNA-binding NarL/FixJ family response regulator
MRAAGGGPAGRDRDVIRVVLADDHNLVRAGIRVLLERIPEVQVVGEASDGREALALIVREKPDLALLDIGMPELNGLEAAARIAREAPRTRLVMLSMHASEGYVAQALKLGVAGYVLKEACVEELPLLLRAIVRGETYLSPGISKQLVETLRAHLQDGREPADPLSPRQREILQLIAEGKSTKEIAHSLGLSVKTVETHRMQIMDRLDIHDVPGLVRYAIRAGLISPES